MDIFKKLGIEEWFILLIVVGYTVFSAFSIPFNIENSRIFSVPYRILIFGLSIFLIYKNFKLDRSRNIAVLSICGFWLLYALKSYISFNSDFYEAIFVHQFFEIYVRIFVIALVPSLGLIFIDYRKFNYEIVVKLFFYILSVMLALNFIYYLSKASHLYSIEYIFTMYYISLGHLGTSLSIVSLFLLLFKPKLIHKFLVFGSLFLGLLTIVIASARSPFLALIVVVPFLILVKRNYKIFAFFCFLLLISIVAIYFIGKSGDSSIVFATRTYQWIFEGNNSLRTPLFERGLEIFNNHKLFGGRTHFEDGMYPHNIILELLMSTGIIGAILYFIKFTPVIKNFRSFTTLSGKLYPILFFSLFLQYLVLVSTSFTLYSVPEFLYFSSIVIGISLSSTNEKNESDDGNRNPSRNN